ncbi:MAG: methyltransferase domain-containing protein [Gammaproteobacteria bacterium]|nr:methyltransferase domain-containing protein [Gammaproteobacteria bacterium]
MRIWGEWVCPRLLNLMMEDDEDLKALRTRTLAPTTGRVLELGFGTGLNLHHYPPGVKRLVAVDPNPGMAALAHERMAGAGLEVEHYQTTAEQLPFDSASFDSVVCTLTLCSIPDVAASLAEVGRVLKPGGQFLFCEHGLHADAGMRRWQHRLNPLWKRVFDGCHINRDIARLVEDAGLVLDPLEHPVLKSLPKVAAYFYLGRARRAA